LIVVIWLIGLSGTGKSTIGREIFTQWRQSASNTVILDGDHLREIFSHDNEKTDYSIKGRKINAKRACALCKLLDDQNINVVCCLLSAFEEHRQWNRNNLSEYFEVFIDVPFDQLVARDDKQLYEAGLTGKTNNVVGIDIPFEQPLNSDLTIHNTYNRSDVGSLAVQVLEAARIEYI